METHAHCQLVLVVDGHSGHFWEEKEVLDSHQLSADQKLITNDQQSIKNDQL